MQVTYSIISRGNRYVLKEVRTHNVIRDFATGQDAYRYAKWMDLKLTQASEENWS